MKELFLPYELAVIAKEKGFNVRGIIAFYEKYQNGENVQYNVEFCAIPEKGWQNSDFTRIGAPLYQQIIDWLREEHKLHLYVFSQLRPNNNFVYAFKLGNNSSGVEDGFKTYYEALNKGIETALNSIEI